MTFFECFGDFLQKIGNFCDLGTVTHQFWSHRYLLPSRKCRKYLWLRNLRPTVPKSQLFPTFVMKSQVLTTISKKGSQFLWLRNRQFMVWDRENDWPTILGRPRITEDDQIYICRVGIKKIWKLLVKILLALINFLQNDY